MTAQKQANTYRRILPYIPLIVSGNAAVIMLAMCILVSTFGSLTGGLYSVMFATTYMVVAALTNRFFTYIVLVASSTHPICHNYHEPVQQVFLRFKDHRFVESAGWNPNDELFDESNFTPATPACDEVYLAYDRKDRLIFDSRNPY